MNVKIKELQKKMAELPDPLLDRFLTLAQGASLVLDLVKKPEKGGENGRHND